jgi:hypothetical protein
MISLIAKMLSWLIPEKDYPIDHQQVFRQEKPFENIIEKCPDVHVGDIWEYRYASDSLERLYHLAGLSERCPRDCWIRFLVLEEFDVGVQPSPYFKALVLASSDLACRRLNKVETHRIRVQEPDENNWNLISRIDGTEETTGH